MQTEITIAGFGGQGIMFAGQILTYAAMDAGKAVTWIPFPEEDFTSLDRSNLSNDQDLDPFRLVQVPEQGGLGQEGRVDQC